MTATSAYGMDTATAFRDEMIDNLIDEVEARPPLYKKSLKGYSDATLKRKLWDEVYAAVVEDWVNLQPQEKINEGTNIRKRWESLRSCFTRELRSQTNTKSGQPASKRRKYVYFDRLLFLLPEVDRRPTVSNLDPTDNSKKNIEETDITVNSDNELEDDIEIQDAQDLQDGINNEELLKKGDSKKKNKKPTYEEQLLNVLKNQQRGVPDEETNFALSLVPTLKNLPEDNKIQARIEILNVLQKFKYGNTGFNPGSGQTPYQPTLYNNHQFAPGQINPTFQNYYQNTSVPPAYYNYGYASGFSPTSTSSTTQVASRVGPQQFGQSISPDTASRSQVSPCSAMSEQTVGSYFSSYAEKGHAEGVHNNSII